MVCTSRPLPLTHEGAVMSLQRLLCRVVVGLTVDIEQQQHPRL
jgi:hypothetical protein